MTDTTNGSAPGSLPDDMLHPRELDENWQDDANCLGVDPDLFFPERGASTREAKEVCRGCVVRGQCLEFALQNGEIRMYNGKTLINTYNLGARVSALRFGRFGRVVVLDAAPPGDAVSAAGWEAGAQAEACSCGDTSMKVVTASWQSLGQISRVLTPSGRVILASMKRVNAIGARQSP